MVDWVGGVSEQRRQLAVKARLAGLAARADGPGLDVGSHDLRCNDKLGRVSWQFRERPACCRLGGSGDVGVW